MSKPEQSGIASGSGGKRIFVTAVGLAVLLSVLCCVLILLIPTQSINVDTVYQGF